MASSLGGGHSPRSPREVVAQRSPRSVTEGVAQMLLADEGITVKVVSQAPRRDSATHQHQPPDRGRRSSESKEPSMHSDSEAEPRSVSTEESSGNNNRSSTSSTATGMSGGSWQR